VLEAAVNDRPATFMADTGATLVVLPLPMRLGSIEEFAALANLLAAEDT
jgi:hypothetical protein